MLPQQFDALSFREILLVNRAIDDAERDAWQRTANVCSFIYNYVPMHGKDFKPKSPRDLFPAVFGVPPRMQNVADRYLAAVRREEAYMAAVRQKRGGISDG